MTRRFAVLVFAAVIGLSAARCAQGTSRPRPSSYAPIVLQVACGGLAKPACVKVVPRIASRTVQAGINLKAVRQRTGARYRRRGV